MGSNFQVPAAIVFDRPTSKISVLADDGFLTGPTTELTEWQIFENGTPKTPTSIVIAGGILQLFYTVDPILDPTRLVYARGPVPYVGFAGTLLDSFDFTVPFP